MPPAPPRAGRLTLCSCLLVFSVFHTCSIQCKKMRKPKQQNYAPLSKVGTADSVAFCLFSSCLVFAMLFGFSDKTIAQNVQTCALQGVLFCFPTTNPVNSGFVGLPKVRAKQMLLFKGKSCDRTAHDELKVYEVAHARVFGAHSTVILILSQRHTRHVPSKRAAPCYRTHYV